MIVCKSFRTFSISYNIYYIFKGKFMYIWKQFKKNHRREKIMVRASGQRSAAPTRTEARGDRRDRREGVKINKYKHI